VCLYLEALRVTFFIDTTYPETALTSLPLPSPPVVEVLVMSGEVHPRSSRRGAWVDRVVALCELAAEEGFFPHTNVGPLSEGEMRRWVGSHGGPHGVGCVF
jgi:hypothetical protein